jgi:hypothetical protein
VSMFGIHFSDPLQQAWPPSDHLGDGGYCVCKEASNLDQ